MPPNILEGVQSAGQVFAYLGYINVALVLFNLIPAFPMDGGRVLRGLLATRFGMVRATEISATVGQFFAAAFFLLGLLGGNFLLALIAVFIFFGATGEAQMVRQRELTRGLLVSDVMGTRPRLETVTPYHTFGQVLDSVIHGYQEDFPVVDENGKLVGMLTRNEIMTAAHSPERYASVRDLMKSDFRPSRPTPTSSPTAPASCRRATSRPFPWLKTVSLSVCSPWRTSESPPCCAIFGSCNTRSLVRVASLLPGATEMVHFAGAGDALVGVTHECDYPAGVEKLPLLTSSKIDQSMTSAEIDAAVERRMTEAGSLYALDAGLLEELRPDLILTQGLCEVCAVSTSLVERAVAGMKKEPEILTLNPTSLRAVLDDTVRIGEALGRGDETRQKVAALEGRLAGVEEAVAGLPRPRAGCIEWLDPPFSAGHWVPEMVDIAGGEEVLARPGERSARLSWDEVFEAAPEVIVLMPCGFDADRAVRGGRPRAAGATGWGELPAVKAGRVWAVDANSHFSRPAPRLVEGVEILARILHPEASLGEPEIAIPFSRVAG